MDAVYVWDPCEERSWGPFESEQDAEQFIASDKYLSSWGLNKSRPWPDGPNYAPAAYHGSWPL